MSGKAIRALTDPGRLYSRSEALSKPSPTPSGPGIYAWYFKEVPGITPADGCVTHDGVLFQNSA